MTTPGGADRNVNVTLNANVDPFQRGMNAATKTTNALVDGVVKLAKKLDELWKSAGRKLELFGAGGLAGLAAATEAASRLDIAFRGVRSTAALTGQSVTALKNSAAELARTLPASNGAVAQLMGQVQDLGVRGTANLTRFTEVALRLGAATNTAPGELFTGLIQLSRTMNGSISDIDRYSSALVALSKTSGVSGQQILGFSNAIEAVAQRAGYTQTQVLGLSTAFAKAGADSGAGATAFIKVTNDISEAMRTGSKQLDTYANLVGKSRAQFQATAQSNPAEAFIQVIDAIKDSGPKGIAILQQLGLDGLRTQRAIAALTSGQADLKGALAESSDAYSKNVALNKASDAAYKDLSSSLEKFRTSIAQITEAIGTPLLGAATKLIDVFTTLANTVNKVLDFSAFGISVKQVVSWMALAGSSVTLLAGGAVVASLAVLKFGMAWRVLSGAIGTNVFRGITDAFRGMPREIDGTTAAMGRLYNMTYKTTSALKGKGMDGGGVGFAKNITGSQGGNILGFPARKLRAEFKEVGDTLKPNAIFNYKNRDNENLSNYSANGMQYNARAWLNEKRKEALNSDDPRKKRMAEAAFGNPAEKAAAANDKMAMQNARMIELAKARVAAEREMYNDMAQMRKTHPEAFDIGVADEVNRGKKKKIKPEDVTDRQRQMYATNASKRAGLGEVARLQQEGGDAEQLNPFKRLAGKIKTISAEMVADVGTGTAKIMDLVVAAFAQSVAKITELALRAKAALMEVRSGAPGAGTAGLSTAINSMSNAGASAGAFVASGAAKLSTAASKVTSAVPNLSSGILGGLGTLGNFQGTSRTIIREGAGTGDLADKAKETGSAFTDVKDRMSDMATSVSDKFGSMTEGLGGKMAALGGKVLANVGPYAAVATAAWGAVEAVRAFANRGYEAANKMSKVGVEFANALGQKFNLPSLLSGGKPGATPSDKPKAYSSDEYKNAMSSEFGEKHSDDLDRFENIKGGKGKAAYAKLLAQRLSAANGGGKLSDAQQTEFRQLVMRGLGQKEGAAVAADALSSTNFSGASTIGAYKDLTAASVAGRRNAGFAYVPGIYGTSNTTASQVPINALAQGFYQPGKKGNATDAAGTLLAATASGMNGAGYKELTKAIGAEFKSQTGNDAGLYGNDITAVIKSFKESDNAQAKEFGEKLAAELKAVGFDTSSPTGSSATAAAAALDKLAVAAEAAAKAPSIDPNSSKGRLGKSAFGRAILGSGTDFNLDAEKPEYRLGAMALNSIAGQKSNGEAGVFNDLSTYTRQLAHWMEVRASNPGNGQLLDLANSQITAAQSGITQQRGLNMTGVQQIGALSKDITSLANSPDAVSNTDDLLSMTQQMSGLYNQQLDTIKSFVTQERQMHRQQRYEAQDHNLQLDHMNRDRNQQLKERNYEYKEGIVASARAISLSFGPAGGFVNSQYTQSARSALTGAGRQNNLLTRSKTGMDTLAKMGVSKDVIREFGLDDPKNVQQTERFVKDLAANPKLVTEFNKSIKGRLKISEGIATDENNSKFADMQRAFKHQGELATKAYQQSLDDFEKAYKTAQARQSESLSQMASDAITGITDVMGAAKTSGIASIRAYVAEVIKQSGNASAAMAAIRAAGIDLNGITGDNSGGTPGGSSGDVGAATAGAGGAAGNASRNDPDYKGVTQSSGGGGTGYVKGTASTARDLGGRATFTADNHNRLTGSGGRMSANLNTNADAPDRLYGNVDNQALAKKMAAKYGWDKGAEWNALQRLWGQESGWSATIGDPNHGAYGIPQAYALKGHGNPMAGAGGDWRTNPRTQIAWGLNYIAGPRYGDPIAAVRHKDATNSKFGSKLTSAQPGGWYGAGSVFSGPKVIGVGEAGPEMVLPLNGGGASFVSSVVAQTMQRTGLTGIAMQKTRTSGYAGGTVFNGDIHHHTNASTNFTGDVHVVSSDPNEMARKLADKKRMSALTRPASSGAR